MQDDPFHKLFASFREHAKTRGWCSEGAKLKFVFDGEVVGENQTPKELDCEDDDVIDVHL